MIIANVELKPTFTKSNTFGCGCWFCSCLVCIDPISGIRFDEFILFVEFAPHESLTLVSKLGLGKQDFFFHYDCIIHCEHCVHLMFKSHWITSLLFYGKLIPQTLRWNRINWFVMNHLLVGVIMSRMDCQTRITWWFSHRYQHFSITDFLDREFVGKYEKISYFMHFQAREKEIPHFATLWTLMNSSVVGIVVHTKKKTAYHNVPLS